MQADAQFYQAFDQFINAKLFRFANGQFNIPPHKVQAIRRWMVTQINPYPDQRNFVTHLFTRINNSVAYQHFLALQVNNPAVHFFDGTAYIINSLLYDWLQYEGPRSAKQPYKGG